MSFQNSRSNTSENTDIRDIEMEDKLPQYITKDIPPPSFSQSRAMDKILSKTEVIQKPVSPPKETDNTNISKNKSEKLNKYEWGMLIQGIFMIFFMLAFVVGICFSIYYGCEQPSP